MMERGRIVVLMILTTNCQLSSGLLGAGTGQGSCAAPPFRAASVFWPRGCPQFASCCSEYGYCQTRVEWELRQRFRDCNGESNGLDLPDQELIAEYLEGEAGRLVASNELLGIKGDLGDIVNGLIGIGSKDENEIAPEILNDVFGESTELSKESESLSDVFGSSSDILTSSGELREHSLGANKKLGTALGFISGSESSYSKTGQRRKPNKPTVYVSSKISSLYAGPNSANVSKSNQREKAKPRSKTKQTGSRTRPRSKKNQNVSNSSPISKTKQTESRTRPGSKTKQNVSNSSPISKTEQINSKSNPRSKLKQPGSKLNPKSKKNKNGTKSSIRSKTERTGSKSSPRTKKGPTGSKSSSRSKAKLTGSKSSPRSKLKENGSKTEKNGSKVTSSSKATSIINSKGANPIPKSSSKIKPKLKNGLNSNKAKQSKDSSGKNKLRKKTSSKAKGVSIQIQVNLNKLVAGPAKICIKPLNGAGKYFCRS